MRAVLLVLFLPVFCPLCMSPVPSAPVVVGWVLTPSDAVTEPDSAITQYVVKFCTTV